jgi:phenylacetic acid degradation operon negative regulatory protein
MRSRVPVAALVTPDTADAAPTARSLVFDLFGDYVRYHGGDVRLRALSELMAAFGITPDTTRVVMQRLRREGWFASERIGRELAYHPTPKAWALLDEGHERIFRRAERPWSGVWHTVVFTVPESERVARDRLRRTLAWLGFGRLTPGVWLSPHERLDAVRRALREQGLDLDVTLATLRTEGLEADRAIAARCWDLAGLDAEYAALAERLRAALPRLRAAPPTGAEALRQRVRLVHTYRLLPFRDPDLPPALLEEGWHGTVAHALFLSAHAQLRPEADAFYRSVTGG